MFCFKVLISFVVLKYTMSTDLILRNTASGDIIPCDTDDDCDDVEGKCIESFCNCNGSSVCMDEGGVLVTKIGESCKSNKNCNIDGAFCSRGRCICDIGMIASNSFKTCLSISDGLDSMCEENVQCAAITPFSLCQDNKCVCQQNRHPFNGTCYKTVEIGKKCADHIECSQTQHSECVDSTCRCKNDYGFSDTKCWPLVKGLGGPCTKDIQCKPILGYGSECYQGFCKCQDLFQLKNTTGKCVKDMLLGETCMDHFDCHQPGQGVSRLECILGECKCKSSYIKLDGYCLSSSSNTSIFLPLMLFLIIVINCF
ncbi:unnamed protein product [Brassicogethes aeneus]|uniref:EB domain-containing protein n=1 Tax=Brassicogethes aeneus TaxID=1431903 RepID=A0A9P0BBD8_BRAAE|nr:unnamed protein product [Brassicogethes aeneus]